MTHDELEDAARFMRTAIRIQMGTALLLAVAFAFFVWCISYRKVTPLRRAPPIPAQALEPGALPGAGSPR